jgi:hypothetical protein
LSTVIQFSHLAPKREHVIAVENKDLKVQRFIIKHKREDAERITEKLREFDVGRIQIE